MPACVFEREKERGSVCVCVCVRQIESARSLKTLVPPLKDFYERPRSTYNGQALLINGIIAATWYKETNVYLQFMYIGPIILIFFIKINLYFYSFIEVNN